MNVLGSRLLFEDNKPNIITHWGLVTHICISKWAIIGSDNGLSPGRRQAIIWTNNGWYIVKWAPRNKLQWNLNQNSYIFIQENVFEIVVWKMAAILSQPQCVKDQIEMILIWIIVLLSAAWEDVNLAPAAGERFLIIRSWIIDGLY